MNIYDYNGVPIINFSNFQLNKDNIIESVTFDCYSSYSFVNTKNNVEVELSDLESFYKALNRINNMQGKFASLTSLFSTIVIKIKNMNVSFEFSDLQENCFLKYEFYTDYFNLNKSLEELKLDLDCLGYI